MILQKSFLNADSVIKNHLLILSILKTVVLLNILVKTMTFLEFFDEYRNAQYLFKI